MRTRSAAVLILSCMLAGGCGLLLGSDDYAVGITSTGTGIGGGGTGGGSTTSSGSTTSTTSTTSTSSSGATTSGTGGSEAHIVLVGPATTTLLARTTQTFSATIDGVASAAVRWSVIENSGGAVSIKGAYTAPSAEGTYHLRATSVATPSDHGDATITVKRLVAPMSIVPAGVMLTVVAPTGNGSQSHLAYSAGTGEWWLFYDVQGMGALGSMHSKDFVNWAGNQVMSLPKGHTGDGRDLSVASTTINGHDVVHITQGYLSGGQYGRYHLRASFINGQIFYDAIHDVNNGGDTPPDGASTVILPDGTVLDSTGWEPTPGTPPLSPCGNGDVEVYLADAKDDGVGSFTGVSFKEQVLWCVGNHVNARQLLSIGQTVFHLYEDGESDGAPVNILMSQRQPGGNWLPAQPPAGPKVTPPAVFAGNTPFGLDDWTGTVAGGLVHAVRRVGGSFEHRILSSNSVWGPGAVIPAEMTLPDSGLFLAPYGDGLILVALSSDTGSKLRYTAFDGATWSDWDTLNTAPANRSYLSGFAPPPPARPALIWTETSVVATSIVGAPLP